MQPSHHELSHIEISVNTWIIGIAMRLNKIYTKNIYIAPENMLRLSVPIGAGMSLSISCLVIMKFVLLDEPHGIEDGLAGKYTFFPELVQPFDSFPAFLSVQSIPYEVTVFRYLRSTSETIYTIIPSLFSR